MEIMQASQATFDPKPQMSHMFVEGFYPWIKHISKDREKLTEVFTHIFNLERFYIAIKNRHVTAMAACSSGTTPVELCRNEFVRVLGQMRGNISYWRLQRHMMHNSIPFTLSPKTGVIEFVSTAPKYRNQGIGYALLSNIMTTLPYDAYMLEVAENNATAFRLYDRLGFKEFRRVAASRRSRAGAFIYMRYSAALKL